MVRPKVGVPSCTVLYSPVLHYSYSTLRVRRNEGRWRWTFTRLWSDMRELSGMQGGVLGRVLGREGGMHFVMYAPRFICCVRLSGSTIGMSRRCDREEGGGRMRPSIVGRGGSLV
jgi:hypothetical protein